MDDVLDAVLELLAAGDHAAADLLADPDALRGLLADDPALESVVLEHGFTGTDRLGRKWVDGKEVASDRGGGRGDAARGPSGPSGPSAGHVTAGLADAVRAADPESAGRPGVLRRLGDAAVGAAARVGVFLLRHQDKIDAIGRVLGAVLDTPEDMKKLGYNPTTAGGQAHAGIGVHDPVHAAGLPVSGHVAAAVAAHALAKAYGWAKGRLAGKVGESAAAADAYALAAELLADLFAAVNDALGLEGAPDAAEIERRLRASGR